MRSEAEPEPVRLADYTPPAYLVDSVSMVVRLAPGATRARAELSLRPNPLWHEDAARDLRLDGRSLKLVSAALDGEALPQSALAIDAEGLTLPEELRARRSLHLGGHETRSTRPPTPRSRASTCRTACTAPSARPRGSAGSPTTPTGPT